MPPVGFEPTISAGERPPEESYRLCCVVVCDLETSRIGAPYIYDISSLSVKRAWEITIHCSQVHSEFPNSLYINTHFRMWYSGFRYNVDPYVDPIFGSNMLPPYLAKKILGRSLRSDALSLNMKAAWISKISYMDIYILDHTA